MYQVYQVVWPETGSATFVARGDFPYRREAVAMADEVRREFEHGTKRKKAAIYDGNRLVQQAQ